MVRLKIAIAVPLAAAIGLALVNQSALAQQNITLTASGKVVDNAATAVPGAAVYIGLKQGNGKFNWTSANPALSGAMGNYTGTTRMVDIGNGVALGANVPYRVFAKKANVNFLGVFPDPLSVPYRVYNVTGVKGVNVGNAANPGNGNNVTVNNIDVTVRPFTQNFNFIDVNAVSPAEKNLAFWDPTYIYTPSNPALHQGTLTFNDVAIGDDTVVPVAGVHMYGNGTQAISNSQTTGGSPLSESLFGNVLQISPLQVFGLDANGFAIIGSGTISVVSADTDSTLFSATIANLTADTNPSGLRFEGDLINPTFIDAVHSQLLANWQADIAGGSPFHIVFDHQLVNNTMGFATSATLASSVGLATVPEPSGALLLLAGGMVFAWRRRRHAAPC